MHGEPMFRSISYHTVDKKGRVVVPSRFRDTISKGGGNGVVVTGMDACLYAYTFEGWSRIEEKILLQTQSSGSLRRFKRVFIGSACECLCDKQGRVLIPHALRVYAGLGKEVVIAGVLNHFEIWSKINWDNENSLMNQDLKDENVQNDIAKIGL